MITSLGGLVAATGSFWELLGVPLGGALFLLLMIGPSYIQALLAEREAAKRKPPPEPRMVINPAVDFDIFRKMKLGEEFSSTARNSRRPPSIGNTEPTLKFMIPDKLRTPFRRMEWSSLCRKIF